jgi:hypothetical protein
MTRQTNARLAGVAYLFYIAVALPSAVLLGRATGDGDMAAKVASMGLHAGDVRLSAVLSLLGGFSALVLAVTLYAITRIEDADLAMLGLACRVAEGITGAVSIPPMLALLRIATSSGAEASDAAATQALAAFILRQTSTVGAIFFAVGSTIFCWLLLRGRMIPLALAWLGVVGSALVAVGLWLQLAGLLHGAAAQVTWIPIALFEITVAVWFLVKGVEPTA